eukprot:IDg22816t1
MMILPERWVDTVTHCRVPGSFFNRSAGFFPIYQSIGTSGCSLHAVPHIPRRRFYCVAYKSYFMAMLPAIPRRFPPAPTTRMLGDGFIRYSVPSGSALREMQLVPAPVSKTVMQRHIRLPVYPISALPCNFVWRKERRQIYHRGLVSVLLDELFERPCRTFRRLIGRLVGCFSGDRG